MAAFFSNARRDPRTPILLCVAFILAVVATPLGAWPAFCIEAWILALALGSLGVEYSTILRRGLYLWIVAGALALLVALSHPTTATLGYFAVAASLATRAGLALGAVIALSAACSPERLLHGLRTLGMPRPITDTLFFMWRYLQILGAERDRMLAARRARMGAGRIASWTRLGRLVGVLFIRAFERGERVDAAMRARGWRGSFPRLEADASRAA